VVLLAVLVSAHPLLLREGDPAPEFELEDDAGERVRLSAFRGRPVVLYFYPADDTPGCTAEACGFRDDFAAFERAGAVVLGVSANDQASHRAFRGKYALPFQLLVDADHVVASRYGAWGKKVWNGEEFEGILRTTFVIGANGRIARVFPGVKPEGHSREVLAAVSR
jgi:peroxiredoxin Q/BCP